MTQISSPLTAENLAAVHKCACCKKPLVSALDLEITRLVAEANSAVANKLSYFNN